MNELTTRKGDCRKTGSGQANRARDNRPVHRQRKQSHPDANRDAATRR